MAVASLRRLQFGIWPMMALFALLLVSLWFMSDATHNSERFGQLYSWLLIVNALGLMILTGLIGYNLYWLVCQYRARAAGALLTSRLVMAFVLLSVLPVSVVYYFSLQFLHRGIDSWFDVQIEQALNDALDLSRSAFDVRLRDQLHVTEKMADEIAGVSAGAVPLSLYDLRVRSGATELTVLGLNGRIIATSSEVETDIVPHRPSDTMMQQVRRGQSYVGLDPIGDAGLHVRAVVPVASASTTGESRAMQALYQVPERFSSLADSAQDAAVRYKQLAYLRKPLKYSYTLTLSLVLLLSLLAAVWAAFYSSRRLVQPIRNLAEGTRAVAAGNYDKEVPKGGEDELGFLVQSFNDMVQRLARARDAAYRSRQEVEGQRGYLEALLGSLSSGVISISADGALRTVNDAADQVLGVKLSTQKGAPFDRLSQRYTFLEPFMNAVLSWDASRSPAWREEVILFGSSGRQVLMCQGTVLPVELGGLSGQVIVFDDITTMIQAQRDAAWGEAARRLAHEIKNPLTPIQLSAERLRHKYLDSMEPEDREVMDRATHTIVQQVKSLKDMVNVFSEYASTTSMRFDVVRINALIEEVLDLYRGGEGKLDIQLELDKDNPSIQGDAGRFRQLLHNLVKNAQEAMSGREQRTLRVRTRSTNEPGAPFVELTVEDNGPGFSGQVMDHLFEPYVTSKPKGTGLGLAIVKKIVEEHGGVIWAENSETGGARLRIRLQMTGNEKPELELSSPAF